MPTDTDFANQALAYIGEKQIASLQNNVGSSLIDTVNLFLPTAKRYVLRAHDWNSARKRALLNVVTNNAADEWTQAYQLPSDFLAFRRFSSNDQATRFKPYSIEVSNDNNKIIYTDVLAAKIVYTADLTDVNRWDSMLFDTCALYLGSRLATALSPRDTKLAMNLLQLYKLAIDEAAGVNEAEGAMATSTEDTLVNVR